MKIGVLILPVSQWTSPDIWPKSNDFCVVLIADELSHRGSGFGELILSAMSGGACSLYFWGAEAKNAEDSAVFTVATHELEHGNQIHTRKGFMTVAFADETAQDASELILATYLPDAVDRADSSVWRKWKRGGLG